MSEYIANLVTECFPQSIELTEAHVHFVYEMFDIPSEYLGTTSTLEILKLADDLRDSKASK